ncbi:hypothetical protein THAOC_35151 [Thalassiosira oceanica]|uniref:Ketoreductase (KR) domain-containing protein n=1 Tax=Thalassiosira oceanica TaxID=159749 RepID=K0RHZ5_THAOC|nr:hypothetical protein THAOC_35151 [Thalassiosira oceanica]|eukprot:EJK46192.1 hypothetical protein THAOC_35151 [Thalassiosira oceanica]
MKHLLLTMTSTVRIIGAGVAAMTPAAAGRPFAIVTGGTRGIGSGIATVLSEEGYDLLLTYNSDKEAADEFVSSLSSKDEDLRAECVAGDISLCETRDEIFAVVDAMRSDGGRLEVVVHNAGQYVGITSSNSQGIEARQISFGDGSLLGEDGRADLEVMRYYQRMYGEAWVDLLERSLVRMDGPGTIVGISSPGVTSSLYGPDPSYSMPGSGKSLMEYSARVYALKAAEKGINVNIIVPGVTLTDAWRRLAGKRGMEGEDLVKGVVGRMVPMKRQTTPRDIGNAVRFLSSDTGRMVTGITFPLEGGLHLRA